jgi:hypothetical protein
MEDETKVLLKQIADLKDDVIVWKRSAETHQKRAEEAETKLAELLELNRQKASGEST